MTTRDTPEAAPCDDCGTPYPALWKAPDGLWRSLVSNDGSGSLCIPCFVARAAVAGYLLCWVGEVVQVNGVDLPFEQPCSLGYWHHAGHVGEGRQTQAEVAEQADAAVSKTAEGEGPIPGSTPGLGTTHDTPEAVAARAAKAEYWAPVIAAMPRDTPETALAAALDRCWRTFQGDYAPGDLGRLAAAILAALDGWTLVPTGTIEGHRVCEENMDAEIARLRAALSFHNKTPTGMTRECLPGCIACAALAPSEP